MTLWFIRGIRRGVVTTRYPARPDASARFLPTPPAFRPQALTRVTARLSTACPTGALAWTTAHSCTTSAGARRAADVPPRRRTPYRAAASSNSQQPCDVPN